MTLHSMSMKNLKIKSNMRGYDADITMCNQDCSKSNTCFRHIMYQNYLADTRKNKPRFIKMFVGDPENCKLPTLKKWD